ncbi:hypothetical protein [Aliarcobacter butzleri]|uniref:hypothetical protein n=1 Tax=Aliarcobacter butzleri TaxID=28197 RepID=UPI0021B45920|nr:hypothetical protein [Aliarcobacter butzleri]MCT7536427.1 hypothetical protein [Aliarcobacter butzleri]MCT7623377.1 hypothetical protein [Aliarcobacter butzleri]
MSKIAYLLKMVFVASFVSLLYFVIDMFLNVALARIDFQAIDLICYFGVINAVNILLSFAIASFVANNLIAYFRS